MMKSIIVALFAAIAIVAAQTNPFYVTNPLRGATLKAGQEVTLTWLNGVDQKVQVNIIQGANPNTMSPTGVSFEVDGESGSYKYTLPTTLAPTGVYAFQFQYQDESGSSVFAYSDPISITGGTGSASPSGTATGTTTVSTATPVTTTTPAVTTTTVPVKTTTTTTTTKATTPSNSATTTPNNGQSAASSIKITALALIAPAVVLALFA
ncbi:hypothetical protein BJ944DRAFT_240515 [Cunninghamella echinulata]|nr:hypothetical protein BJ944DRAFT_240515 [Cunninghamella echinulata]